MNQTIWNLSDLVRLSRHKNSVVRRWACERVAAVHGRDGIEIIESLLKDDDEGVLLEALHYLYDFPDSRYVSQLAELYKNQTSYLAGMIAGYLARNDELGWIPLFAERRRNPDFSRIEALHSLCALGQTRAPEARKMLETVLSEADDKSDDYVLRPLIASLLQHEGGLDIVLGFYAKNFKNHFVPVLHAIFCQCGFPYPHEELQEQLEKRKIVFVDKAVKYLKSRNEAHAAETFAQFFSKKLYFSAIRWLSDEADKKFVKLTDKTGRDFEPDDSTAEKCLKALSAFKAYVEWGPEKSHKFLAVAAVLFYSRLVGHSCLTGLDFASANTDLLLEFLLEDRYDDTIDDQIIDSLVSRDSSPEISKKALEQIKRRPSSFGTARAVKLLGKMKDVAAIPAIASLLASECNDRVYDECVFSLVRMGIHFVEYVISGFSGFTDVQKIHFLQVLQDIPREETIDLFLHHWQDFWRCDKVAFIEALECIAAKQFIVPLRRELMPEEIREERAYYLLCKIHEEDDVILAEIEERLQRQQQELKALETAFSGGEGLPFLNNTLKLQIKCRNCEKVYTYEVEEVFIDNDTPLIRDKIVCKNCRAINQYDLTTMGKLSLMASFALMTSAGKDTGAGPEKFSLKVGNTGMMDGRRMSVSEIHECYDNDVKNSPDDPALRVGYGNVLMRAGKELEAVFQYKQAIRLDPMAVEAYLSLGEFEDDKGNPEKAREYFQQAYKCMFAGNYYRTADREGLQQAITSRIIAFEGRSASDMEDSLPFEMPVRDNGPAVGRNDPCPCGSGKKYKKCCLK